MSATIYLGPRVHWAIFVKLLQTIQSLHPPLPQPINDRHQVIHPAEQHLRTPMLPVGRTCALRTVRVALARTSPSSPLPSSILARLASTLAILEQREGRLNTSSLGAITAAQKIGGSIHGLVAGPKSVAEAAAKVNGLEKVLMVDNSAYDKASVSESSPSRVKADLQLCRRYQKTSLR